MIKITRENYTVEVSDPEVYVDNEARGRSGHMSHAMAQFAPNQFLEFNSNCSAKRCGGHSTFGWIEYRKSLDGGKTYSPVYDLEYSKKVLLNGEKTISLEKAIACKNGNIVAFCLVNAQNNPLCCENWTEPTVIISRDQGETWSEPKKMCEYAGRVYEVRYHNDEIYVLMFCNPNFVGSKKDHLYRLFKSSDYGESFVEVSTLPFLPWNRAYAAMVFDTEGVLHAYAYQLYEEKELEHAISRDCGKTWEMLEPCYLAKKIRNPQIGYIDGVYVMHGRGGDAGGFVLYTSLDATNWDEGIILVDKQYVGAYYSQNLNLYDEKGNFLLIQYSDTYDKPNPNAPSPWCARVNAMHISLRVTK